MQTFKCNHHSEIVYSQWAKSIYGENKCIVSPVEKGKSGHNHVHFIGYCTLSLKEFQTKYEDFSMKHPQKFERNEDGKLRFPRIQPCRKSNKEVNELGFQYVMKTSAEPVYSQGFTEDELKDLKSKSDEHADQLKSGMKEHCHKRKYEGTPDEIYDEIAYDCVTYNGENGIAVRPQFKSDVNNVMNSHPDVNPLWRRYLSKRMTR